MQTSASSKVINENVILKNYEKKVKEEVRLINENLFEMLKLLKIDDSSKIYDDLGLNKGSQAEIDSFEIEIRSSNLVKSTESLSKIVSDLKDLTILNDFKSINSQITSHCQFLRMNENDIDIQLRMAKDVLFKLLQDLQNEYYTSRYK
ncbi:mediator of RNA polymerase II transcription subunit 22 isoform X2 [Brachionus plicatilis]|uniref:Mediator of RNA polymerase II transcription subunit 22 n=1 Tax=Brachionus plicatilis TaxID=10195 RepID=A0A3M7S3M6_BRAPC|nr:mediator of RNA polymerase II transcription subunit 22 isoform X2 [Brachionus plicatilis]